MFELSLFMERIAMPSDMARDLLSLRQRIDANGDAPALAALSRDYYARTPGDMSRYVEALGDISRRADAPVFATQFLMYAQCADPLYEDYRMRGLSDDIYWDTVAALREELMECVACKRLVGGYESGWLAGFFDMTRFRLGRFQYELHPFRMSRFARGGNAIHRGEQAINVHIPSSGGPMTREARMDSYRRAYAFFRGSIPGGERPGAAIPFQCDSWLLFPAHEQFLTCCPNIIDFMRDYEIVFSLTDDAFANGWRIFADRDGLPLDRLPRDTSMQRAYIDWMAAGNRTGGGLGVFFFDGERIVAG